MPSWLTHFAVFTKAFDRLPSGWKARVSNHPTYAFVGAIYPDMFYAGFLSLVFSYKWSDMMHYEKSGKFARAILSSAKGWKCADKKKEKLCAFALGYVTHVATDITIHPFTANILANTPDVMIPTEHARCEMHQDSYLYYECENALFADVDIARYLEIPKADRGNAFFRKFPSFLVKALRECHVKVYGKSPSPLAIELSYIGAVRAITAQVVVSSTEIDRRCIECEEGNYKKYFEDAVARSSEFLECACKFLDGEADECILDKILRDRNLDTGEALS